MQALKYLGVGAVIAVIAVLFHKGVKAGAYSDDRSYSGAVKSIFRRGGAQPK